MDETDPDRRTARRLGTRADRAMTATESDAAGEEADGSPEPPSKGALEVVGGLLTLPGILGVVVGVGGILFSSINLWLRVLCVGLAAVILGVGLAAQADQARFTDAWRHPASAVGLLSRRLLIIGAAAVMAAGLPLFILKLSGYLADPAITAANTTAAVVSISGSCSSVGAGPLASSDDAVTCHDANWTVNGTPTSGTLHGTLGEVEGRAGSDGQGTHVDSVRARVRGSSAYTAKKVGRPGALARLDALPNWTWAGIPISIVAGLFAGFVAWTPHPDD